MEVVPAIAYTLRLIGFTLGASLDIFLLVTLVRRWRAALAQGLTASVLVVLALQ